MLASNTLLLRDAIPTNGIAPRIPSTYEENIIHLPNSRNETAENIEITKFLRNLSQSANLSGAVMTDPTREEFDAKLATVEARTETRFVELGSKMDRVGESYG